MISLQSHNNHVSGAHERVIEHSAQACFQSRSATVGRKYNAPVWKLIRIVIERALSHLRGSFFSPAAFPPVAAATGGRIGSARLFLFTRRTINCACQPMLVHACSTDVTPIAANDVANIAERFRTWHPNMGTK